MTRLLTFTAIAVVWVGAAAKTSTGWTPRGEQAPAPAAQAPAPGAPVAAPAPPAAAPAISTRPESIPQEHRDLMRRYCASCHNQRGRTPAGDPLYLDTANLDDVTADPHLWERVIRKTGVGAMPPQGPGPRPAPEQVQAFRAWLITTLDAFAEKRNYPGRFVLHRMNRAEYANAIRDLLAVEIDVTGLLPPDSSNFGFDNIASALMVTPALLERYLTAAVRISNLAVGDPKVEPAMDIFPIRLDLTQNSHMNGLPLGTRGGTLVRYTFPADGEYVLSGSLFRPIDNGDSGLEGQDSTHTFEITIDGVRVHSGVVGGPADDEASFKNLTTARDAAAERMKGRVFVTAGPHDVGFTFVERPARSQDIFQVPLRSSQDLHVGAGLPKLRQVAIGGPYSIKGPGNTPSRQRLFVCRPGSTRDEPRCARQILSTVARRAYRRPITDEDLAPIMQFYDQGRKDGTFEDGIRAALPRILASPSFLFRSEQDRTPLEASVPHPVSDLELASRLSFFLWSSIPDDELLNLASSNKLRGKGVLEQQVRRMLADEKANAFYINFAGQWLAIRNLERSAPDLLLFPDWDHNLRSSMQRETEMFFASIVRENRGALDLLNADYTFLNERLARHYGIPNVYGSQFRRVTVQDPNRRGILGQGSILTITSVATRTSPVFRGKWILQNILNTPPLPPPPDVPALEENTGAAKPKSVRERLEMHRKAAVCSSCHRNMDPLGFALENFNAVGQWRSTTEAGTPVDAAGVLVDGTKIDGPVALRDALSKRPDVFVGTVTEKMLTYALGRGLEAYDMPVVRGIVRNAASANYQMHAIVTGIVQSRPFQMRVPVADDGPGVE